MISPSPPLPSIEVTEGKEGRASFSLEEIERETEEIFAPKGGSLSILGTTADAAGSEDITKNKGDMLSDHEVSEKFLLTGGIPRELLKACLRVTGSVNML